MPKRKCWPEKESEQNNTPQNGSRSAVSSPSVNMKKPLPKSCAMSSSRQPLPCLPPSRSISRSVVACLYASYRSADFEPARFGLRCKNSIGRSSVSHKDGALMERSCTALSAGWLCEPACVVPLSSELWHSSVWSECPKLGVRPISIARRSNARAASSSSSKVPEDSSLPSTQI